MYTVDVGLPPELLHSSYSELYGFPSTRSRSPTPEQYTEKYTNDVVQGRRSIRDRARGSLLRAHVPRGRRVQVKEKSEDGFVAGAGRDN